MATNKAEEHYEVHRLLQRHPVLSAWGEEDKKHYERLHQERGGNWFTQAPYYFPPEVFAGLVLGVAKTTGIERQPGQSIQVYLKKALKGKTVAVVGARYGLLQKVFEVFGAKTYGIDKDEDAVEIARKRGLEVAHGNAADIDKHFSGKKPDFIVSFNFFDPHYWETARGWLPQVLAGLARHSTSETIHLHSTFGEPTPFYGFNTISKKERAGSMLTALKKQAVP